MAARQGGRILSHGGKNLTAALLAWQASAPWGQGRPQFLAVATALLVVNTSTVHHSMIEAARRVAIQVAGVTLAIATAWWLGPTTGSIMAVLAVILAARGRRAFDDHLQVASTALLTLTAAAAVPVRDLALLALATVTGAIVGTAVHALILPPVHVADSRTAVRRLARATSLLLRDMGRGLRQHQRTSHARVWLSRARQLEEEIAEAQDHVRLAEDSLRWNIRCSVHGPRRPGTGGHALLVLHGISLQVRGIARTLVDTVDAPRDDFRLGQLFTDQYARTLELAGQAVEDFAEVNRAADPEHADAGKRLRTALDQAQSWHDRMTELVARGALTEPGAWHIYGSLVTDAERLLSDLHRAGTSEPMTPMTPVTPMTKSAPTARFPRF
ncbi:aromatic acid exporter family protein [Streptomyces chlorus]|uniref:FUSC family protein n=1 Tax=Streptomyces chlorus TaxID=887452 RepID=A0ABW1E3Z3_9ACTN